ncbi:MAG: tyrosine/phenylalanine carboxypeptidase domain-containing protein [Pseudomonadota bacterium]
MTPEDTIQKADHTFFEILHDFRLFHYLNPVNSREEREKFLAAWEDGKTYQPVFEYNPLPATLPGSKKRLADLTFGTTALEVCFDRVRAEYLLRLELAESRGTPAITLKAMQLYGTPNDAVVKEAIRLLDSVPAADEPTTTVGVKALATEIREKLRADRIEGWDVVEDPLTITFAEADSAHHKVRLLPGIVISGKMLDRLLHHVVEVHVYRAANGERQPLRAFSLGLDGYIETEEGLALVLEERLGLLIPPIQRRLAGRMLAAALAPKHSFFDMFRRLVKFFSPEEAYTITVLSKRGLRETHEPGGYVRDHIYSSGTKKIKDLTADEIHLLYTGRIAVHHLPLVKELMKNKKLVDPAFLPAILHG